MYPKIKIPRGIWNAVSHTRKKRKAVCTFLVLKCVCESGKFKGYIEASGESLRNFNRRIEVMQSIGLLSHSDGYYQLASWETVQDIFSLPANNKFYYVPYAQGSDTTYDLEDEFYQLAARDAIEGQKKAIKAILNVNKPLAQEIRTVADAVSSEAVFHTQLRCWINEGMGFDPNEQYILLNSEIRFDTQCSTDHYNYLFEYHGRGSWCYRRNRLERLEMVKRFQRRIELPKGTHTTLEARKCDFGHVQWIDGKLWLILPDEIVFFKPSERRWMNPKAAKVA